MLRRLVLRDVGLLDEGATAVAAALVRATASAACSSGSSGGCAGEDDDGVKITPDMLQLGCDFLSTSDSSMGAGVSGSSSRGSSSRCSSDATSTSINKPAATVPRALPATPPPLQSLDLSHNTLCDAGALALADALAAGAAPALVRLLLSDNRLPWDADTVAALQQVASARPALALELGQSVEWAGPGSSSGGSSSSSGVSSCAPASSASSSCDETCGVCLDAPNALSIRGCGHHLCAGCYKQLVRAAAESAAAAGDVRSISEVSGPANAAAATCPFCRAPIRGFRYIHST
jgi:Leucine Rich repeat